MLIFQSERLHTIPLETLLAFTVLTVGPCWLPAQEPGDDDIVSNAMGLRAIQRLVSDDLLQKDLDVSPAQLRELREYLNSEEVRKSPRRTRLDRLLATMPDDIVENQDFGAVVTLEGSVDDLVAREVEKILHPQQLTMLRVSYLRDSLRSPSAAFSQANLAALGLRKNQIDEITTRVSAPLKSVENECARVRARAVATLLKDLPEKTTVRFVQCFGAKYVATSSESFDVSSIGVFEADRGFLPLSLLGNRNIEIRQQVLEESRRLRRSSFAANFNTHQEVKKALQKLASPAQYESIFEFLHLLELERDLRCIYQVRVVGYLEIAPELIDRTRDECDRLQQEIDLVRLKLDLPIFKSNYEEVPQEIREKFRSLYDGVWCELK